MPGRDFGAAAAWLGGPGGLRLLGHLAGLWCGLCLQHRGIGAGLLRRVVLLDEQPVLRPLAATRLHPHQHEAAREAVALQPELQLPCGEIGSRVAQWLPGAGVPDLHRAGAVVAFGDGAVKVGVVDRVVLDPHRQALVGRIERGPFRHRPTPQHAVMLQPEIPVQPARVVLLHDEPRGLAAGSAGSASAPASPQSSVWRGR